MSNELEGIVFLSVFLSLVALALAAITLFQVLPTIKRDMRRRITKVAEDVIRLAEGKPIMVKKDVEIGNRVLTQRLQAKAFQQQAHGTYPKEQADE